jgi:tetratricopeptide (TPR) repeat protein
MNAKETGNYEKALKYYNKKRKIELSIFGRNYITTAQTLDKMGIVYWNQGNYPIAFDMFKECLSIQ